MKSMEEVYFLLLFRFLGLQAFDMYDILNLLVIRDYLS